MLKNGVYKSIQRTPDGRGAVITLSDGSVTWSDYSRGFCTMPQKSIADLAQAMMRAGEGPVVVSDIKKIAAADAEKSQNQTAASGKKTDAPSAAAAPNAEPAHSDSGGVAAAAPDAGEPSASSPEPESPAADATLRTDASSDASAYLMGQTLGRSGLLSPRGKKSATAAPSVALVPPPPPPGELNHDQFEFLPVRRAAQGRALQQLRQEAAKPAQAPDGSLPSGEQRRGFGATTN